MQDLHTHAEHTSFHAVFTELNGAEAVLHYGSAEQEFSWFRDTAGIIDLSFRSRLVITGEDRVRFLHSQCTNDIRNLKEGQGCYTFVASNKGKIQADAGVLVLDGEILIDAEPGLTSLLTERLEHFIVSDDVEVIDAAPHYGLLSVQGPRAGEVFKRLHPEQDPPPEAFGSLKIEHPVMGEIYVVNNPRLATRGLDLFVPVDSLGAMLDKLIASARESNGGPCGWEAFDRMRILEGIPRHGVDMDESNLAPEAGIDARAISYQKGCYIGQEIINRLRTFAEASKVLRRLKLPATFDSPPLPGTPIVHEKKEIGRLTSTALAPDGASIAALGYLRKQWKETGKTIPCRVNDQEVELEVVGTPWGGAVDKIGSDKNS